MAEARRTPPTARRLARARSFGLVARSPLLTSAVLLAVCAIVVWAIAGAMGEALLAVMTTSLGEGYAVSESELGAALYAGLAQGLEPLMPALVMFFAVALLVTFVQVGPTLARRAIRPDLSRLAPAEGLRRLLTPERALRGMVGGLGVLVIIGVTVAVVRSNLAVWVRLPSVELSRGLGVVAQGLVSWLGWSLGLLIIVGGLDLLIARALRRRRLMMTRSESDRERRDAEGDPVYRAERRRLHRALLDFDFERAVRSSTLMIAAPAGSPAECVVGLYYDPSASRAPELLAKGRGQVAKSLLELAGKVDVPIVDSVELSNRLQRLSVGDRIPDELFGAVARAIRAAWQMEASDDA